MAYRTLRTNMAVLHPQSRTHLIWSQAMPPEKLFRRLILYSEFRQAIATAKGAVTDAPVAGLLFLAYMHVRR